MNLHHLKVFLAVAEAGSISAGAERLHISQPAVTREIRDLEASLDLRLFDRQPRGVQLTEGAGACSTTPSASSIWSAPPSATCATSPSSARAN